MAIKDMTGQKFGKLKVLYKLHNYHKKDRVYWLCACECGNLVEVRGSSLRNGHTSSCGCLQKEIVTKHGKWDNRIYRIWAHIKDRCYNKNHHAYKHYGGRGIFVCSEWKDDFEIFYNWAINNGYDDTLTIDRIDNNGNYEPNNCRWTTRKQQCRNQRNNTNFTYNGETHCLSEWCDILGLNKSTIYHRIYRHWSIEKALELEG